MARLDPALGLAGGPLMTSAQPAPGQRPWPIVRGLLLAVAAAAVMVGLYYVLPLGRRSEAFTVLELVVGLLLLAAVIAWQLQAIIRSDYPAVRAAQVLAVTSPLFLLLFAAQYFVMSLDDPSTFTKPLSRSDALYFTVTVFSTVGFGDITARVESARLVVTAQMVLDLVVLGLGVRVVVGAVQRSRTTRTPRQGRD